ncbi:MAG: pyridoxamine 5-phosphate oxidase [Yoonia sp.]|uniref:pyridoxamine 5-phosphate oxidase n=1 Tax=Yoonia sp. TaxID=2212373 RepID=UPI003EF7AF6A
MTKRDPINPTTDAARQMARAMLDATRFGALAVTHPDTQTPYVARVAMLWQDGALLTLVSTLSLHTRALMAHPACAALIGEPEDKGDPLTHPRMTLMCKAEETDKTAAKPHWLAQIPKAKLYYDFSDFRLYRLTVEQAHLNGGFGKAFHLTPDDLAL